MFKWESFSKIFKTYEEIDFIYLTWNAMPFYAGIELGLAKYNTHALHSIISLQSQEIGFLKTGSLISKGI